MAPGVCKKCGDPKPPGRGREYCDECRKLTAWANVRRSRARRMMKRKPCRKCGGPKPAGQARWLCNNCLRPPAPPRICPDCEIVELEKGRKYCDSCRASRRRERKKLADAKRRANQVRKPKTSKTRARKPQPQPQNLLLPARPLGLALERIADKHWLVAVTDDNGNHCGMRLICKWAGLWERTVFGWRNGERMQVKLSDADDILTRLDLLWFDVWNEDTVRKYAFEAHVVRNIHPERTAPLGPWTADTIREAIENPLKQKPLGCRRSRVKFTQYVDLGPDHQKLAEIRRLFEPVSEWRAA